ncbi:glycerol-3-phosphate ABC transporter ATP-binding protein [Bradyrhizobium sp. CCBAU 11386]|uniref:ABC transporter ATP-binding protein n=1 Tax=Bradyrhizobium sp. CCBAU 11386 TaxID=1630837 RepID=UPI002304CC25|nr:ABC transporter ATP-binding protein [Bradyrhizobium sp. CCBAU 11386]MDA9503843.1 glycerol-3-phosphate ABC transporter ATP-binding protein [Bradyrhizobium sp. CCBAU 11386]
MAACSFQSVTKSFGSVPVLRQVSLEVSDGEFLTLLGPSGCGKSTLLRVLAGLAVQDSGSVVIGGRVVDGLPPKRRDVAMVFQSYALYPHMSVADNMMLPLRMRCLSGWQRLPVLGRVLPGTKQIDAEMAAEVAKTAKALGIDHLLERKPGQLSGGQRQRVAVGRAMVRQPAVFLMDEPLSNLDAKLRVQMRAEIKELHRRLGLTFIYVTHDQAEAMTLSDRVAVMLEGELLQVAPPQEIYSNPAERRVAEFIGSPKINMLEGQVREGGLVEVAGSTLAVEVEREAGAALTLGIRPEAFHIAEQAGPGALTGSVRLVEHVGSDLYVHLDMPGVAEPVIARLLAERAPHIATGQTLNLRVWSDRVLLFDREGARIQQPASVFAHSAVAGTTSVRPIREYAR